MPYRRRLVLLLLAGPMYAVASLAFHFALDRLSPPGLFALPDMQPVLYGALALPPVLLLLAVACGIWLSLRILAGRRLPVAAIKRLRFAEIRLRADELVPLAAGLAVAVPALQYFLPLVVAAPTAGQFHLVQLPGVLAPGFVLWVVWSMPVSRVMKGFLALTPTLMVLHLLLRDVAAAHPYAHLLGLTGGSAYMLWFLAGPVWLIHELRKAPVSSMPVGESSA